MRQVGSGRVESSRVESSRVESSRVESSQVESSRVKSSQVESSRVKSSQVGSSRDRIHDHMGVRHSSQRRLDVADHLSRVGLDDVPLPASDSVRREERRHEANRAGAVLQEVPSIVKVDTRLQTTRRWDESISQSLSSHAWPASTPMLCTSMLCAARARARTHAHTYVMPRAFSMHTTGQV